MRPYDDAFAAKELISQNSPIRIGDAEYRVDIGPGRGVFLETFADAVRDYPIVQALGGKDVYYFLTPLENGRLQTLPLAYDVRKKEWFDVAASGSRHFENGQDNDVNWKEWPYAFNTACYNCHVSQLSTNYDPKTDTYHTTWEEPGINCEACHGPGGEHVHVCEEAPKGIVPKDLKIMRGGRDFTIFQKNDLCAACHAKAVPLTLGLNPGERFFDHFDLVGLESPDFYPDGRDLGENYTISTWLMSPCVRSGKLDCMHCHTSSGRYKFTDPEKANEACSPCHADRVANAPAHTHHLKGSEGGRCISCHMPMTEFARMRRSDHSMLPPTPAATMAFGSPNACNNCHKDKNAAWADAAVRSWHADDYQAPVVDMGKLVTAARQGDWSRLTDMLVAIAAPETDEVRAASLIRLLRPCADSRKLETLFTAAKSTSPLIRAAAIEALGDAPARNALSALAVAASDEYRLVRIQAAAAFAQMKSNATDAELNLDEQSLKALAAATDEYLNAMSLRPDLWTTQHNLGNYAMAQGEEGKAAEFFERAAQLDPKAASPLVNASIAYGRQGETGKAEKALEAALAREPKNALALFNLGLVLAERNDLSGAETKLREALASDPSMAEAAYNLSVLLAKAHPHEALAFCRQAASLRPDNPRYWFALSYFLYQSGETKDARVSLERLLARFPNYKEAAVLLAQIRAVEASPKKFSP